MLGEIQSFDGKGTSSVTVSVDEYIANDFSIDYLVSSSLSSMFDKSDQSGDYLSKSFNPRSFLGLLATVRQMGWTIIGVTASYSDQSELVRTFYLENDFPNLGLHPT